MCPAGQLYHQHVKHTCSQGESQQGTEAQHCPKRAQSVMRRLDVITCRCSVKMRPMQVFYRLKIPCSGVASPQPKF